jgi:hypothetical protein
MGDQEVADGIALSKSAQPRTRGSQAAVPTLAAAAPVWACGVEDPQDFSRRKGNPLLAPIGLASSYHLGLRGPPRVSRDGDPKHDIVLAPSSIGQSSKSVPLSQGRRSSEGLDEPGLCNGRGAQRQRAQSSRADRRTHRGFPGKPRNRDGFRSSASTT